jgi:APA family basic amino acid/polyamine antiporter
MNNIWQPKPGDRIFRPGRSERPRLHRTLGVPALFSTAYGDLGSSIYYALGVVALSALGLTPAVLLVSGILFLFTAFSYAEGASALPEAGGSGAFARRAFNEMASFLASWVLMMDYIVTIAISAFSIPNYLGTFVPVLKTWPTNSLVAIGLVAFLAIINIRGVRISSRLNIALAILDVATQVTIGILGVVLLVSLPKIISNIHWGVAPTTKQLLFGISISMVAYTGIETIANLSAETRNPTKNVPRAHMLVSAAVITICLLLSITAVSAYPVYQNAEGQWVMGLTQNYLTDPVMGIVKAMPANIQGILSFWVALLAGTILLIATNAGILGASRLAYFMGRRRQVPPVISHVNPKSRTPVNAILFFSVIGMILISTGRVTLLVDLYAFGAMLAYTATHLSIIALRIKEPTLHRPFKIPLNVRIRQIQIPIPAVIGALGTATTWFIVIYTHVIGRVVGFIWIGIGLSIYILYRRHTHQSLFKITPEGEPAKSD